MHTVLFYSVRLFKRLKQSFINFCINTKRHRLYRFWLPNNQKLIALMIKDDKTLSPPPDVKLDSRVGLADLDPNRRVRTWQPVSNITNSPIRIPKNIRLSHETTEIGFTPMSSDQFRDFNRGIIVWQKCACNTDGLCPKCHGAGFTMVANDANDTRTTDPYPCT